MNWRISRTEHTMQAILDLPVDAQLALLDLFDALEADPYAVTEPHGIDDKLTREAAFGEYGLLVMFVNPLTMRITPLSFMWAG
ncbi:hypothetical protein RCO28_34520 [Streptomyces sp. LHD-70]|uniref:hypothetical protein n=1 Tax=Streptomyces sp. LHD-70 TaxID=3072140 RepID=UPI00280D78D8|nr:hypothetical protein [Streptomyces sp. LHD-70]MDQ8707548.1 hypothetical protein [Streptomyces sp. LHD-70]